MAFAVHTESRIVDLTCGGSGRRWQRSILQPAPQAQAARDGGSVSRPSSTPPSASRPPRGPFSTAPACFAPRAEEAARNFSDFLREQFADFHAALGARSLGAGVGNAAAQRGMGLASARRRPANISSAGSAWSRPGGASMMRSAGCNACGPMRCAKPRQPSRRGSAAARRLRPERRGAAQAL